VRTYSKRRQVGRGGRGGRAERGGRARRAVHTVSRAHPSPIPLPFPASVLPQRAPQPDTPALPCLRPTPARPDLTWSNQHEVKG
jgi:hypothetical protein